MTTMLHPRAPTSAPHVPNHAAAGGTRPATRRRRQAACVHKFGGAAVASGASLVHAASLVAEETGSRRHSAARVVVVVSALAGVTDELLALAGRAASGDGAAPVGAGVAALRARHLVALGHVRPLAGAGCRAVVDEAFDELDRLLLRARQAGSPDAALLDLVVARGERLAAHLFREALAARGVGAAVVDATRLVHTDGRHGEATPDVSRTAESVRRELEPILARGIVAVVPGFIGRGDGGDVVTLGRGGSDLTATLVAASLGATEVVFWKDVAGIHTADPRVVPGARLIPRLSAREAAALAEYGARVLHPRALDPVEGRTRIVVRSFARPELAGTVIHARGVRSAAPVRAVAAAPSPPGGARLTSIGVVGTGIARDPRVAARVLDALGRAGVEVAGTSPGPSRGGSCLSVTVPAAQAAAAQRAIHDAFLLHKTGGGRIPGAARHDVVLLGCGAIGRALLGQLVRRAGAGGNGHAPVRVCAVIDSGGVLFDARGLSRPRVAGLLARKAAGGSVAGAPGGVCATAAEALRTIDRHALHRPVLVDATAADTTALLADALARGWDVVLANKVPLAAGQDAYDRLREAARAKGRRILHEATVGAGLPVIGTLLDLQAAGDRVLRVQGCPSGTLGFLFGELASGRAFSAALLAAVGAGYTEPDPRLDLSGVDVARKALILARLLGFRGSLGDVRVESLVPDDWRALDRAEFLRRLPELDASWRGRVAAAAARGRSIRYRARATPRSVVVGLVEVAHGDPLAALAGTDNQFAFTTRRYRDRPLVITGPGAGAEVTAAGVYGDLLRLAAGEGADGAIAPIERGVRRGAR